MASQDIHLAQTTKYPGDFYFQSTNTPGAPNLCLLLYLMLRPKSRTWGLGLMLGLGASQPWAWDTAPQPAAGLTAHPSDYIWALSGPCGPRPRPCCFPGTQADTGRGPGAPGPSMAMCPPGCQGPGPRGRGKIPSERPRASLSFPWDQRPTPQRKVCLHPPWRPRSSLPLKGHEPLTGSGPPPGRGHLHRAPRRGLLTLGLAAVASRHTGQGGAQRGYVTHPRSQSLELDVT